MGLDILTLLAGVIAIFLYSNRKLQMTITNLAATFAVLWGGIAIYFLSSFTFSYSIGMGIALPALATAALLLAFRYIQKDEKLVRSMDRLR
jgi:peptidoglycan/LPS O-acetylase OafA/YrhL